MRTFGGGDEKAWICQNPKIFDTEMVQSKGNLDRSYRSNRDIVDVTRGNQELGSLFLLRQCLKLNAQ